MRRLSVGQKPSSGLIDNDSSEVHPIASILSIFNGSFGNNQRPVQPFKERFFRLDSWMILSGRKIKLFPLRFNSIKDDKQPRTSKIAGRLQ